MNYHFIAVGGSVMHNLAIALHLKGHCISGSDDEIFEPSRSRLMDAGLLPDNLGWDKNRIYPGIDAVIVGMHARSDNPELEEARNLGITVYSFPEFLFEQTREKKRVVIAGSHGKTTITSMVMHVLKQQKIVFDYLVGAKVEGFEVMVGLNEDSEIAVFEGDEYLTSPLDRRPKFHLYHPNIALVSGIAWDHFNVFPTLDNYREQFRIFLEKIIPGGVCIYYEGDPEIKRLTAGLRDEVSKCSYKAPDYLIRNGKNYLIFEGKEYPVQLFGRHNMENISGAWEVCRHLEIKDKDFLEAIGTFKGAARRLEKLDSESQFPVYWDFAHAPSKVKATVEAVKQQYPGKELVACLELHTFSSLNKDFLKNYYTAMEEADQAIVFFNPHALAVKRLEMLSPEDIRNAFAHKNMRVFNDSAELQSYLKSISWKNKSLLFMSSGDFNGMNIKEFSAGLV